MVKPMVKPEPVPVVANKPSPEPVPEPEPEPEPTLTKEEILAKIQVIAAQLSSSNPKYLSCTRRPAAPACRRVLQPSAENLPKPMLHHPSSGAFKHLPFSLLSFFPVLVTFCYWSSAGSDVVGCRPTQVVDDAIAQTDAEIERLQAESLCGDGKIYGMEEPQPAQVRGL